MGYSPGSTILSRVTVESCDFWCQMWSECTLKKRKEKVAFNEKYQISDPKRPQILAMGSVIIII